MKHATRRYAVLFAAGALLVATGCSSDSGGIGATEADFTITLDADTAPAGDVTFDIQNDAGQTHEFVVVKTDLAPDALPTDDAGDVDEKGDGITPVDEVEDITAGSSETLTVKLDAGSYVVICNLPSHYKQGMHAGFTVT
ncbi:MAG: sulfocyanin-like copper-binding protein [Actinomycetota bacterium]